MAATAAVAWPRAYRLGTSACRRRSCRWRRRRDLWRGRSAPTPDPVREAWAVCLENLRRRAESESAGHHANSISQAGGTPLACGWSSHGKLTRTRQRSYTWSVSTDMTGYLRELRRFCGLRCSLRDRNPPCDERQHDGRVSWHVAELAASHVA